MCYNQQMRFSEVLNPHTWPTSVVLAVTLASFGASVLGVHDVFVEHENGPSFGIAVLGALTSSYCLLILVARGLKAYDPVKY